MIGNMRHEGISIVDNAGEYSGLNNAVRDDTIPDRVIFYADRNDFL